MDYYFFCVLNNAFRSLVNFSLPNATNACCHVALSPLSSSTCFFTLKNSYAEGISCQIFLHSCLVCECNQANFFLKAFISFRIICLNCWLQKTKRRKIFVYEKEFPGVFLNQRCLKKAYKILQHLH